MVAIDTNILVYAEMRQSQFHERAFHLLSVLANGAARVAVPWPCIYEFLRVVTHASVYHPPAPMERALANLRRLLESPSIEVLTETDQHHAVMERVLRESGATGNLVHDAHVAALCIEHGIREIITGDRDFLRFGALIKISNPFSQPTQ